MVLLCSVSGGGAGGGLSISAVGGWGSTSWSKLVNAFFTSWAGGSSEPLGGDAGVTSEKDRPESPEMPKSAWSASPCASLSEDDGVTIPWVVLSD